MFNRNRDEPLGELMHKARGSPQFLGQASLITTWLREHLLPYRLLRLLPFHRVNVCQSHLHTRIYSFYY